jgi:pyruvate formate lyase activating enzyme
MFFCDIKQIDVEKHKAGTGSSNAMILDKVKRIAAARPLKVRVPLIPDFNDSPEDIKAIGDFVRTELHSVEVELLAYNKMGESKYPRLNREVTSLHIQEDSYVEMLRDIIRTSSGIESS